MDGIRVLLEQTVGQEVIPVLFLLLAVALNEQELGQEHEQDLGDNREIRDFRVFLVVPVDVVVKQNLD